jgi:8-oxo-dGTP pyrophosphatase MutT (NUDIX family)
MDNTMHRQQLLQLLARYRTPFMEEAAMVERSRRFIKEHVNCFDRHLMPGHVSGSAWVVNPDRTHVLMMHHRKLDLWLQPGGHADNDPDILRVVLKECAEESGIALEEIRLVSEAIFDVDVHTVHASVHDPRHEHFDIRFLVEIDDRLPIPGNDESHEIGWIALDEVARFNNARSIYRLVQKTRRLLV